MNLYYLSFFSLQVVYNPSFRMLLERWRKGNEDEEENIVGYTIEDVQEFLEKNYESSITLEKDIF